MLVVNFPAENINIKYKERDEIIKEKLFDHIDKKAFDYLFNEQRRQ